MTSHTELAEIVLDESGYTEMWQKDRSADAAGRLDNLKELVRSMEEFENLQGFLEHISLVMDRDGGAADEAVSLMTLHSAKGLEFDNVFLPGWEEGLFPSQRTLDEQGRAGLEEERRLAHVGLTRARRRAKLYFATNRRIHGTWSTTIPSRFLDELPAANVEITESKGGSGWGGSGGYGPSRFDNVESFGSSYTTPGWQRAQANRTRNQGNRGQARGGFEESQSSFSGSESVARCSGSRGDAFSGGFSRNKRGPMVIEGELVAKSTGTVSEFSLDDRVFHQKFGYGHVVKIDGNKLTIAFEKAGEKKVVDSFVERAHDQGSRITTSFARGQLLPHMQWRRGGRQQSCERSRILPLRTSPRSYLPVPPPRLDPAERRLSSRHISISDCHARDAIHHIRHEPLEDLRLRVQGAEQHQPGHQVRRDFCAARAERRRQDHADQHHLRHRQSERGQRHGRRVRHQPGLSRRALADRAGAAGTAHRRLRDACGRPSASAAACSASRRIPAHIEKVLKDLSLWDKKDSKIITLSGGMKRRVMIAKALSHEPKILFLDEPTAGVDVELRKGMWEVVRTLQAAGVTIILTTHYIEEAEEMADRIGVINKGEIILVEDKAGLMAKLGKKELKVHLQTKIDAIPAALAAYNLELSDDGHAVIYDYDTKGDRTGITSLLSDLRNAGIRISDLDTRQSSLEDIFVSLVRAP